MFSKEIQATKGYPWVKGFSDGLREKEKGKLFHTQLIQLSIEIGISTNNIIKLRDKPEEIRCKSVGGLC